jgi:hypothetical protein
MTTNKEISNAAAALGRKGGSAKSEAKTAAVRANGAKGGRPGMYSVTYRTEMGESIIADHNLPKYIAIDLAKKLVDQGKEGVFVEFFRRSDHQRGYLNQDGNHDINGRAWQ